MDNMNKFPNFFIIGAPKCGTTSLSKWLSEHPNIYISKFKEPHFYNTDLKYRNVYNIKHYIRLFKGVKENHKAIGEASVFYLFSKVAVYNIEKNYYFPKYIVMIRNPIEMAYSLYQQQLFSGNENIKDFEKAWYLSPLRREGKMVSRFCRDPKLLDYQSVCLLGSQLKRLFDIVPRERIHIINLDDVKINPRNEYIKVLKFLDFPDDNRIHFPIYNKSKRRRSRLLRYCTKIIINIKSSLNLPHLGILSILQTINKVTYTKPPLSNDFINEMINYYKDDICLIEELINRDLSNWKKIE